MTQPRPSATCEVAGCDRPAVGACDNCGHLCCAVHLAPLTLARRGVAHDGGRREPLARLPVSTETYALCPRCSKRPFAGKPPSSARQP